LEPSRLVMVKFLISIVLYIIFLVVRRQVTKVVRFGKLFEEVSQKSCPFWKTDSGAKVHIFSFFP